MFDIKRMLVLLLFFPFLTSAHSAVTIKVGIHESKPLSIISENGSISGIYPEVIDAIALLNNWEIEWVKVSWVEGLKMVEDGRLDLLGPIAFTEERLKKFDFNEESVLVDWGQLYLPDDSEIMSILDLEGKKIVFQKGHAMGNNLLILLRQFDINCEVVLVKNQKKVFEMISNGKADAGTVNRLFGIINEKEYDVQRSPIIYSPMELRFAAPKTQDKKILEQLDLQLSIMKKNKDSDYLRILDKYLFGKSSGTWYPSLSQVILVVSAVFVIGLVMLVWMLSLRSQVRNQTKKLLKSTRELEKANQMLSAVLDNTTDAVYIKNLSGEYILANSSTCEVVGKPLDQVIGKTDAQLFPSNSAKIINEIDEMVIKTEKTQLAEEKLDAAYGETWWLANKTPYLDKENKVIGLIGISRNITELKKAQLEKELLQSQLRQAHKMEAIGTLTGGIAHDFNNILGIIMGNLELALDDIPEHSPVMDHFNEIKKASLRARDVVRQLLNYSRKSDQKNEPVNINSIVEESFTLLKASMPSTIDLIVNHSNRDLMIDADATGIHQVLINLGTNAVHAMEADGGVLNIEVLKCDLDDELKFDIGQVSKGEYIQINVKDTGMGIEPERQKKIFDPYYTSKETGKGTGMGLAIVQGIVINHHGAISVKSDFKNGTAISIFFPLSKNRMPLKQKELDRPHKGTEKILLVDDEDALLSMEKKMLEGFGYKVVAKTDSQEALDLFILNPSMFDLVITDMTMPHLTGDKFAKSILKIRPDIPIILCTGYSSKIDDVSAKKIGISRLVEKPLDKNQFVILIRETLDENQK